VRQILVDSSVWIDFFNGANNATTDQLSLIISREGDILTCPPIIQEVLQGFKSDADYNLTAFHLDNAVKIESDVYEAAHGAAQLFRKLRKQGITIRKGSDCLIAWYALKAKCFVLHKDRDFDLMAKPLSLKILH
jgi:predicted nucleic acid-binding protein